MLKWTKDVEEISGLTLPKHEASHIHQYLCSEALLLHWSFTSLCLPFVFESGFCVPKQETRPVPTILCSSRAKSTWKKIGKLMLVAYISANRQHNQTSTMVSFTWRLIIPDNASLLNLPLPSFLEKKWILMGETPKKEFTRFQNGSSLASLSMSGFFFWNLGSLICWRSRIYHANSLQSNILEPSLSKQKPQLKVVSLVSPGRLIKDLAAN